MNWKSAAAGLLMLGCLFSGVAKATSLEITPIAVYLVPGQTSVTIEVTNRGGADTAIHLRAFGWAQSGDKDVLTPTRDIILSPPIFTISKGATQTIRLLVRPGAAEAGERNYRLLIDEVPPASLGGQNVVIAMRVSVPVIVASAAPEPRELQWRARRGPGGTITLSATNVGNSYERVQAISVALADGSQPAVTLAAANTYVLAGVQRQWIVAEGANVAQQLRLSVTTQSGKSEQILALEP